MLCRNGQVLYVQEVVTRLLVTYYIKWVTISWTNGIFGHVSIHLFSPLPLVKSSYALFNVLHANVVKI